MEKVKSGQMTLKKADRAMNKIYDIVKRQEELEKTSKSYLSSECSIPLPKYLDGGIFKNHIQSEPLQDFMKDEGKNSKLIADRETN